jgi:tRNA pseudouridine38-40 synthase
MPRYFVEVAYNGTAYSGFQIQDNANSIQAEVEKALEIFYRQPFALTGSSRTDAGVHALQNYFQFDADEILKDGSYNINAILPADIVVKRIFKVPDDLHCRFNARSRTYRYNIYQSKNPFLQSSAYFFPYKLNMAAMQEAAALIKSHTNFESFSKRNTQTKTKLSVISVSEWKEDDNLITYHVQANRFLRGMVRGLVGTMLQVGRNKLSVQDFENIIIAKDCTKADFSAPPQGLFLVNVAFAAF